VRPTRDGIHGREYISTVVDIGEKPAFLTFDTQGQPVGCIPKIISLPLPILLDVPPASVTSERLVRILAEAARQCETLSILRVADIRTYRLEGNHIVPLVSPQDLKMLGSLSYEPRMIEITDWDEELYAQIKSLYPSSLVCLRLAYGDQTREKLLEFKSKDIRVFHLTADYHGRGGNGELAPDLIRRAHQAFVDAACRNEVTLLGSGGIIMAEHMTKAIICGLDAVALDTAPLVALQIGFKGECTDPESCSLVFNKKITPDWGVQRLKNLLASWHDQMLEIAGAMGIREVRRMRGEMGRAMFQKELEQDAFGGIKGYV
jgi:hypothetical protein